MLVAVHIPYMCKQWLFFFYWNSNYSIRSPQTWQQPKHRFFLLSFAILHFPKSRQSGTESNETKWCWRIR